MGEGFDGIGQVDALTASGRANLELIKIERSDLFCQTVAKNTVVHAGRLEHEGVFVQTV